MKKSMVGVLAGLSLAAPVLAEGTVSIPAAMEPTTVANLAMTTVGGYIAPIVAVGAAITVVIIFIKLIFRGGHRIGGSAK